MFREKSHPVDDGGRNGYVSPHQHIPYKSSQVLGEPGVIRTGDVPTTNGRVIGSWDSHTNNAPARERTGAAVQPQRQTGLPDKTPTNNDIDALHTQTTGVETSDTSNPGQITSEIDSQSGNPIQEIPSNKSIAGSTEASKVDYTYRPLKTANSTVEKADTIPSGNFALISGQTRHWLQEAASEAAAGAVTGAAAIYELTQLGEHMPLLLPILSALGTVFLFADSLRKVMKRNNHPRREKRNGVKLLPDNQLLVHDFVDTRKAIQEGTHVSQKV